MLQCPALEIKHLFAIVLKVMKQSQVIGENGLRKMGYLPRVANFDGKEVAHLYDRRHLQ
jgi:hypothetical protein